MSAHPSDVVCRALDVLDRLSGTPTPDDGRARQQLRHVVQQACVQQGLRVTEETLAAALEDHLASNPWVIPTGAAPSKGSVAPLDVRRPSARDRLRTWSRTIMDHADRDKAFHPLLWLMNGLWGAALAAMVGLAVGVASQWLGMPLLLAKFSGLMAGTGLGTYLLAEEVGLFSAFVIWGASTRHVCSQRVNGLPMGRPC